MNPPSSRRTQTTLMLAACLLGVIFVATKTLPSFSQQPSEKLADQSLTVFGPASVAPSLMSLDGRVRITFAPHAALVSHRSNVASATLTFSVPQTMPARLALVGPVFAVDVQPPQPTPVNDVAPQEQTTGQMTITIQYDPPSGITETELVLAYLGPTGKWLPLDTRIDATTHTATASATLFARFALVWLRPAVSLPPNAIITDYPSPRFVRNGTLQYWYEVTGVASHYANGQMFWTWNRNDTYDNWASWHVPGTAGYQEVFAFVPWDHATSTRARYRIGLPNNPSPPYVEVNQNNVYAEWVSLGVWSFGSQDENWVTLSDRTYETAGTAMVGFDAIAMARRGKVFMPVQIRGSAPARKLYSGMHLGNRNTGDWPSSILRRIDPAQGGTWPSAVVVLSSQVYHIERWPSNSANPCRVLSAWARPDRPVIWDYLRRAAQAGVKIVIRLHPSPGNYLDWNDPSWSNHHLIRDNPAGPEGYCRPGLYRSIADLADEMGAIHTYNVANGFSEHGFEPANEPNHEWYDDSRGNVRAFQEVAWSEMDSYFAGLHYYVHNYISSAIRVLTPPMAPSRYAETNNVADYFPDPGICDRMVLIDGAGQSTNKSGYETMPLTYGTLGSAGANDGVDWHNYWYEGKEGYNFCPDGQHVSLYFPQGMKTAIVNSNLSTFISEADLSSANSPTPHKDGIYAGPSADSIREFIWMEAATNGLRTNVVVWLLNDDGNPSDQKSAEHQWHQAYTGTVQTEREWFPLWWNGAEN